MGLDSESDLEYFFRVNGRSCIQIKVKNPKRDEYLKLKITWEIKKFIFLENHFKMFIKIF